jgi:PAS domain S-box-containing protein/diguanylate cyclase (GGDEF)-like protein
MFKQKLLKPAVIFMNRLPFRLKIISAISVLFLLLILPSFTIFTNFYQEYNTHKKQEIGLFYTNHIQKFIKSIQLHRGLTNAYLNGNKKFKQEIIKNEREISQILDNLITFDKNNMNILKHNRSFVEAISKLLTVKIKNISPNSSSNEIFNIHNDIISNLISSIKDISNITSFSTSNNLQINYIAKLLQDELLLLMENTGQLRGVTVGVFSSKDIDKKQEEKILSYYTLLKSLEINLSKNKALSNLDNYFDIQQNIVEVIQKLDKILFIVNKNIILNKNLNYDAKLFFKQATQALDKQVLLYDKLSNTYINLIKKSQEKIYNNFIYSLIGFLLIIISAVYLTLAFYHSIAQSLKKLQLASRMIADGKTDINLKVDTKDELGDAVNAFNYMSEKLGENISFLNGYKMAIDETSIVSKTDKRGIIIYANKKFCEISGYSEKELIGMPHNLVRHPDVPKEVFKDLWKTIKSKKIWHGIVPNRAKDGSTYVVDATIIPVLDKDGELIEYIAVRHDVTELEKSKEELKKNKIDVLTGLANRTQLLEDLNKANKPVLLYLNIDDFTSLNDFYGNKLGDRVLIFVTEILKNIAKGSGAKAYKLQSDEFVLVFDNNKITKQNCHSVKNSIIQYIEEKSQKCDPSKCISITLSGGIAFYTSTDNYENLLPYAALARKVAKQENKKFIVYSRDLSKDSDYQKNMEWITKIREAIDNNKIVTYFQPIIENKTGTIKKYESLVRMIDSDGKVISPFFFLDIAKKAKLYLKITKIVIDKTFDTFLNHPNYEFSLNLTVEDIKDEKIVSYLYNKLSIFPNPQNVVLEITESEKIEDYKIVDAFIKNAKKLGAKIAIDDFGSGYANFEHIVKLEADFIKIDGSLIKNIDTDINSRYIAESIIDFSKKIGAKTIAEFIHKKEIYDIVRQMGADYSQGFYLGEPSPKIQKIKDVIKSNEF